MSLPTSLEVPNIAIAGADALAADVNEDFDYLSTALNTTNAEVNLKAPADSPALSGIPVAPTAAVDTSTTQLATTAFVIAQAGAATPLQDEAAAAVGTSTRFARQDHIHPINPQVAIDAASASASATSAQGYMLTAVSASASAGAAWDNFDDRYLGSKTADPTLDNDGNAILSGALYFNTTSREMRVYSGSAWAAAYLPAAGYATLAGVETLTNKTLTGPKETKAALAANDIDMSTGTFFTKTISGATTLTVSNVPASGVTGSFIFDITNGGSAAITWWSGVKWAGGTAPTLTASGRDVLGFYTYDGGTTWTGLVMGKDVK